MSTDASAPSSEQTTHAQIEHGTVLHVPALEGEAENGLVLGGIAISNTIIATWIFMVCLGILVTLLYRAITTNAYPRLRSIGITSIQFIDDFITDFIGGDRPFGRKFFFLFAGFFVFILLSNFFGLIIDWLVLVSDGGWLHAYIRPINSDLNTTFVMSVLVVVISQAVAIRTRGPIGYARGYLFNFSGHSVGFRFLNVFVGWLHGISEVTKVLSLALRLFGNMFAGIVLLGVIAFLTSKLSIFSLEIGQLAVIPFWLFELFVAAVQAIVFFVLMLAYMGDAKSLHDH